MPFIRGKKTPRTIDMYPPYWMSSKEGTYQSAEFYFFDLLHQVLAGFVTGYEALNTIVGIEQIADGCIVV